MHILVAADADYVVNDVAAALGGPDVSFTLISDGRAVAGAVKAKTPDIAILDLQVGSMGGMAIAMALRLDESAGALEHVPLLMLLDRRSDIHLARRCGAEGYLVKPLNPLKLRRAVQEILAPADAVDVEPADGAGEADSAEQVPAAAG